MNAAALLVFLLSHQGYWIGGQEQSITIGWIAQQPRPKADLVWELGVSGLRIDGGTVAFEAADRDLVLKVKPPVVRVRTPLTFAARLIDRDSKKVLDSFERTIYTFPADLLADLPRRVLDRQLTVWDAPDGALSKTLDAAKVQYTRVDDLSKIRQQPDLVLVAADRIEAGPFGEGPLQDLARGGASIAVLEQRKAERLLGYPLQPREPAEAMRFAAEHPIFQHLTTGDLQSWLAGGSTTSAPLGVQLPPAERALELAWWPREAGGDDPAPIDALAVTRTLGQGRIVLLQLPIGPFDADPRSQILLSNLLGYLTTRPEPTPAPADRNVGTPPKSTTVPHIKF